MRKLFLLLFVCTACLLGIQAADLEPVWEDATIDLPRDLNLAAGNDLVAISSSNEVYVTGVFNKPFSFGTSDLENIANSTYLIKYNADGSKAWGVSLKGAATPTAITVAEDGSVYVAGTLASIVVLGSTDDNTQQIEGIQDSGAYIEEQAAAFLVQYSAAGVLQKYETFKPLKDPEDWLSAYGADVYMSISKLQLNNNKLYAGLVVGGDYENDNNVNVSGGSFLHPEFFMDMLTKSGYVVSLDDDLKFDAIITKLALHSDLAYQANVFETSFAIEDQQMVAVYTTMGKQVLTVGTQTEDITFTMTPEGDDVLYAKGYLIAKINLADKTLTDKTFFENKPIGSLQASSRISAAKSVDISGESLVFTGVFQNELPFNNEIVAVNDTNIFITSLKMQDLSVEGAKSSGNAGSDSWSAATIVSDTIYAASNNVLTKTGNVIFANVNDMTETIPASSFANLYVNALASKDTYLANVFVKLEGEDSKLIIRLEKQKDSETGIKDMTDYSLSFYPNPVKSMLYLNKVSDINIYNLSGSLVAQAKDAREINLEFLTAGSYIISAKNMDGVRKLSFIKE